MPRHRYAIMRSSTFSPFVFCTTLLSFLSSASALRLIESKSLNACQDNSSFTASLFNVIFTPDNLTLTFDIVGVSSVQGNVSFGIQVQAYGLTILKETLNPCTQKDLSGMCPMSTGQIDIQSNIQLSQDTVNQIPGIAYGVPDLDANVKVLINQTSNPDVSVACVEASLSNGQTVDQKGVWMGYSCHIWYGSRCFRCHIRAGTLQHRCPRSCQCSVSLRILPGPGYCWI